MARFTGRILLLVVGFVLVMPRPVMAEPEEGWDVRPGHDSGLIDNRLPVFGFSHEEWAPEWTQIWIQRDGENYDSFWIPHGDAEIGEELRWAIPDELPRGEYRFWMRGWSEADRFGVWSDAGVFQIFVPAPERVILLAPEGEQDGPDQTLRWQMDDHATHYQVRISSREEQVYQQWSEMSGPGEAEFVLSGFVEGATYTWWVRSWGPGGFSEWSEPMSFSIASTATAEVPLLIEPSGQIDSSQPTFSWEPAVDATMYRIVIRHTDMGETIIDSWLESTSATLTGDLLPGNYRWWVGAWNTEIERTMWSEALDFRIQHFD